MKLDVLMSFSSSLIRPVCSLIILSLRGLLLPSVVLVCLRASQHVSRPVLLLCWSSIFSWSGFLCGFLPSVLCRCWLSVKKGIRPVKNMGDEVMVEVGAG